MFPFLQTFCPILHVNGQREVFLSDVDAEDGQDVTNIHVLLLRTNTCRWSTKKFVKWFKPRSPTSRWRQHRTLHRFLTSPITMQWTANRTQIISWRCSMPRGYIPVWDSSLDYQRECPMFEFELAVLNVSVGRTSCSYRLIFL